MSKASEIALRSIEGERTITEGAATRHHKVELRGLTAGRIYRYTIDGFYSGSFTTPLEQTGYSVVAVGHTHGSEDLRHYPDPLLVAKIADLRPDLVLHSGDITYYPTVSDFNEFYFRPFRSLLETIPVYVSPGNHDSRFPRGVDDFSGFRQLFPHRYGGEEGAYYSFEYKNAKFIALSYVTLGSGVGSKQYEWLGRELESSNKVFNIVFMGGANFSEKRSESLFKFLSEHRVDLVLGGDGAGVHDRKIHGVPYYFTGTSGPRTHSLRYIEFDDYYFKLQTVDARGQMHPRFEAFTTQREVKQIRSLGGARLFGPDATEPPAGKPAFEFLATSPGPSGAYIGTGSVDIDISPESFDAVSVVIKCKGRGNGNIRLYWRAVGSKTLFRLQSVDVAANRTYRYLLKLPQADPLEGKGFQLAELRLYAASVSEKITATLEDFSLVKFDPEL